MAELRAAAASVLALLAGCAEGPADTALLVGRPGAARASMRDTVCPDGATTAGIDVSYWQGSIDWSRVAADGVDFAFIRVSYGLDISDSEYQANWKGARDAGLYRGTYQYFLAAEDASEQARLLLDDMGQLEDGDLPPVLDVESYGNSGVDAATVDAGIREWLSVVEAEIGRKPLIYTSWGEWEGMSGSTEFAGQPLWIANWGVSCPTLPDGWHEWDFWQYSDSGQVDGIGTGATDLDVFNGGLAELDDYATWGSGGGIVVNDCDDRWCAIPASGSTVIEEDGECACLVGQAAGFTEGGGHGGHSFRTVADVPEPDYAEGADWFLDFDAAGSYELWAYVPELEDATHDALYKVFHGGGATTYAEIDQSASPGEWVSLGTFDFDAGSDQWVRLGDDFAHAGDEGRTIGIDAIRVEPASEEGGDDCACDQEGATDYLECSDGGTRIRTCDGCDWSGWSPCEGGSGSLPGAGAEPAGCGCSSGAAARPALAGLLLVLLGAASRRSDRSVPGAGSRCP